jgi:DNA-directed RNA polymerase subunit E'/Rpb7
MITTKVLETSVDLFNPDDIYALDVPKLLTQKLTERYQNKCFSSILITKILDIIRYSDRKMVDNRLDGGAYIDVEFRVEGVILTKGEVLHGCSVANIASFGIIIKHPHAVGIMTQDLHKKAIAMIKKDQIVPVIVEDAKYNVGKSQITISCKPYTPQPFPEVLYNITEILSPEDTEKIDDILTILQTEEKLHKDLAAEPYAFFKSLVYPYKTNKKFHMSPIGSNFKPVALNLKSLLEIRDGCITISDLATNDFLVHSKKTITNNDLPVINSPLYPALSSILHARLQYMTALRGFIEQYDTTAKTQDMLAYWKVCMSLKE